VIDALPREAVQPEFMQHASSTRPAAARFTMAAGFTSSSAAEKLYELVSCAHWQ